MEKISASSLENFKTKLAKFETSGDVYCHTPGDHLVNSSQLLWSYLDDRLAAYAESLVEDSMYVMNQCESPIEQIILAAVLRVSSHVDIDTIDFYPTHPDCFPRSVIELMIESQVKIEKYRIDFKFTRKDVDHRAEKHFVQSAVLVECDGHDFHERTKEQAKRDRAKDRRLQELGFKILRFTGSEIHADPFGCAMQILNFIKPARGVGNGKAPN